MANYNGAYSGAQIDALLGKIDKIADNKTFSSSSAATFTMNDNSASLLFGYLQDVGNVFLTVSVASGTLTVTDFTGTAFTSEHITITWSSNVLSVTSDNASDSYLTIISSKLV